MFFLRNTWRFLFVFLGLIVFSDPLLANSISDDIRRYYRRSPAALENLQAQNAHLSYIAKAAFPAVVNISSTRKVPYRSGSPYDYFYGGRSFQRPLSTEEKSLGSGFFVREDGYILSNYHVVEKASDIVVILANGDEKEATLVGSDPQSDVALLKIEGDDYPYLTYGDSDMAQVGEMVLAMGNPFSVGVTFTTGVISGKGRNNVGVSDFEDFIQTDAAINPGNSGGPLLNIFGEVIGMNTAILSRTGGYQGISFTIPSNMVADIETQLRKNGQVERAYLGVTFQSLTPRLARAFGLKRHEKGILVNQVDVASPAALSGLKVGDIIRSADGVGMDNDTAFRTALSKKKVDETFLLEVYRDGFERQVSVRLKDRSSIRLPEVAKVDKDHDWAPSLGGSMLVKPLDSLLQQQYGIPESIDGVLLVALNPKGAAAGLGLASGDVIQSVANEVVLSETDLIDRLDRSQRPFAILVYRRGSSEFVIVE